jgi:hypothetical protein
MCLWHLMPSSFEVGFWDDGFECVASAVPHAPMIGAPEIMKSFESTAEGAESAEMLFVRIVLSAISACSAVK